MMIDENKVIAKSKTYTRGFKGIAPSFKPSGDVLSTPLQLIPKNFTLRNFDTLFNNQYYDFFRWYWNTIVMTGLTLLLKLLVITITAYGFAKIKFPGRDAIFLVLLACSAAFAMRLHLFEPVLRHHYNPKTHKDEIVTPDDPAFAQEEQAQRRHRRELHEKHREQIDHALHRTARRGGNRKNQ